jgi:nitroreductase
MKDFLSFAKSRYSVRKFSSKPVEKEKVDTILEAGRLAPTACNKQPFQILVLQGKEDMETLEKCTVFHYGTTLAFLVSYNKDEVYHRDYDDKPSGEIDTSIVATHMMLAAWDLGIGSTWIMHFIPEAVKEEFQLPDYLEPIALLMMGYPAVDAKVYPGHTQKKTMDQIVTYHKYHK